MKYQVKQNKKGNWEAIISNPNFNYKKIFTYETKGGAELRIKIEKEEANQALADVASIWDYFKPIKS